MIASSVSGPGKCTRSSTSVTILRPAPLLVLDSERVDEVVRVPIIDPDLLEEGQDWTRSTSAIKYARRK